MRGHASYREKRREPFPRCSLLLDVWYSSYAAPAPTIIVSREMREDAFSRCVLFPRGFSLGPGLSSRFFTDLSRAARLRGHWLRDAPGKARKSLREREDFSDGRRFPNLTPSSFPIFLIYAQAVTARQYCRLYGR
jgi:hypothetical protein